MGVNEAVEALEQGEPVLVYDAGDREAETDMMMAAEAVDWQDVRRLRNEAGGLIAVAIPQAVAERFGVPLPDEASDGFDTEPEYDNRSSLSISVNHASTYTGVTDRDRATTIGEIAAAVDRETPDFHDEFRAPGHVHLIVAAPDLLAERQGHTEMAVALSQDAEITPAVVVCEMLDDETGKALPREEAERYAKEHDLVFVDGRVIG